MRKKPSTSWYLLPALLALSVPVGVLAEDDEKSDEDGVVVSDDKKNATRKVDTTSPEALALKELLNVEPKYGKDDKKVELLYAFNEPVQLDDWTLQGFDLSEADYTLRLGVGSQRQGLILHNLHLKGDFEVELSCSIEWIAPSSHLVFVFNGGKTGSMFGTSFAKRGRKGYKPVNKKALPSRDSFNGAKMVKVKLKVEGGEATSWVNGRKTGATKKLKGKTDGRFGIYMTNLRLHVSTISIKGGIDTKKL